MIAFSVIWFLLIAGVVFFPMLALRQHQGTTWWDYVYPFTGVLAWFLLSGAGSTVSLANFVVEVFWIAVISALIPWLRWLMLKIDTKPVKEFSLFLTFLPILAAVIMRLTIPTLPE